MLAHSSSAHRSPVHRQRLSLAIVVRILQVYADPVRTLQPNVNYVGRANKLAGFRENRTTIGRITSSRAMLEIYIKVCQLIGDIGEL